jgi:hypothetical protein
MSTKSTVLSILKDIGPVTDEEMIAEYEIRCFTTGEVIPVYSGIRSRRADLVKAGLVVSSGYKRNVTRGHAAQKWAAVTNI